MLFLLIFLIQPTTLTYPMKSVIIIFDIFLYSQEEVFSIATFHHSHEPPRIQCTSLIIFHSLSLLSAINGILGFLTPYILNLTTLNNSHYFIWKFSLRLCENDHSMFSATFYFSFSVSMVKE